MPKKKLSPALTKEQEEKRFLLENDLAAFIEYVHPRRVLGGIHREVINWWGRSDAKSHQLLLLPRDHGKSAMAAYRAAQDLTRDPTLRILYISSTSNLAVKQLKFIKDILTCDNYRQMWPEMIEKDEAKREKWTEREISVDHPLRKDWNIRDPSIFTAGLTTNIVGMHADKIYLDDVVVAKNAYIEEGREKVKEQYGYLSSIASTNAQVCVVGTRYHPLDLYNDLMEMEINKYDEDGEVLSTEPLFEKFERQVESIGDGSGEYLWPLQKGKEGRWFGFNAQILGDKRSQYLNKTHFRAQYYNDPYDIGSASIGRDYFQYYDQNYLANKDGRWYFRGERLNICAAVDFAYSTNKTSDYTSIVVVGTDNTNNHYILDIDRFKTDRIADYYTRILKLYEKWGFPKLRAEVSVAQQVIVKDLKENYIRKHGLSLAIDEFRPSRWQGAKEERIRATLEPRYANRQVWHYRSGNIQVLEEELLFANPAHDDVKDALASAIDFAVAPMNIFTMQKKATQGFQFHGRFGGVV